MIIDAYSHVCPSEFIEAISRVRPSAESEALRSRQYLWDMDARISYMDRVKIDVQVMTLVRPPMWLGMKRADVHNLTRIANDSIAAAAATYPDRLVGVGVLPVIDDVMMEEFERIHGDLGLKGVLVFSNIEGDPLDSAPMWSLYERCAALEMPIWIHPQLGHYYPWDNKDLLNRSLGWPFDTSLAMARLVYGGVFEKYPDLKVMTHHLGGMIPHYAARMDGFDQEIREYASKGIVEATGVQLTRPVTDHFRRFYNDAMVNGSPSALRCGLEFFGPSHVLYGTDFPMGTENGEAWPLEVLDSIMAIDIDDHSRDQILSGNAIRLLGL